MKRRNLFQGVALAGVVALGLWQAPVVADESLPTDTQVAQTEHRGGTIRIVASSAGGTIDPHINYTLQYWMLYQATYDGLMAFKRTSGEEGFKVVPDLAADMPVMSNDGKTLTFTLRDGIKFSDGSDLGVDDVLASFQRIFKVSSPTAGGFYAGIVGADLCLAEPATCTLDGGVVVDAATRTVTLNLVAPDAEIFYKLALPHAAVLPAETAAEDAGTNPIPGTGPYMIASYDPNTQLRMVRNPHFVEWSKDAQPDGYADEIIEDFGLTGEAQVTAVQNGEADFMFDQVPVDRLAEIGSQNADQIHINTLTAVWYAPMNVNVAPFNDVRVRQAVNYAIDRNALVNLFGGPVLAQPVCQVLPPGFPGHVDYCPYTLNPEANVWSAPDLEKAKALVAESGTAGQEVTVIAEDNEVARSIGTYLASVLTDLGYKASMKAISSNIHFTYIQNTNNNVQISVTQWYQDYPAASDFLYILLSCDTFNPGSDSSINIAGYCDEAMTKRMTDALALGVTDQAAADAQWATIDRDVTDAAPWAALFTPKKLDFVSKRLGNYTFSPQFYWIVSQSWVQ